MLCLIHNWIMGFLVEVPKFLLEEIFTLFCDISLHMISLLACDFAILYWHSVTDLAFFYVNFTRFFSGFDYGKCGQFFRGNIHSCKCLVYKTRKGTPAGVMNLIYMFRLFVLGLSVSLTLFQSHHNGDIHVIVFIMNLSSLL